MIEGSLEVNRPTSLGEMEKAEVGIYVYMINMINIINTIN